MTWGGLSNVSVSTRLGPARSESNKILEIKGIPHGHKFSSHAQIFERLPDCKVMNALHRLKFVRRSDGTEMDTHVQFTRNFTLASYYYFCFISCHNMSILVRQLLYSRQNSHDARF